MAEDKFDPTKDSWGKGEPIPAGMPSADVGGSHDLAATTKDLADLQRRKIAGESAVISGMEGQLAKDQAAVEAAHKAAGFNPNDLKPWNEEQESAKHETDPIQAFGSLGSVMGILAAAFTHQPIDVALNASASAINAVKAGNKEAYERARKAWEANTKLALDRHKIMHEQYSDAMEILKTNLGAGEAKLRLLATKFGDQKALTLLEHGMDKELIELQTARETAALKMAEAFPKVTLANAQISRLFALGYDTKNPGSAKSQEALQKFNKEQAELKRESSPYFGRVTNATTQADFVQRRMQEIRDLEGREPNADDILRAQQDWTKATTKGVDEKNRALDIKEKSDSERERHNRAIEEINNRRGDTSAALAAERARHDKEMERIQEKGKGAATTLTKERQIAADVNDLVKKYKEEHPGASEEEIADYRTHQFRRLGTAAAPMTSNRADDIRGKVSQVELAETTIGHIEDMLKRHNAITGLGGKVTRPGEVVGNVFGSNETDRKQFERWVNELQEIAPRILLDSKGRPLSSEAGRVENIIAGLKLGDTTANTARAYYEFRKVLKDIKGNLRSRLEGTFDDRFKGENAPGASTEKPADNSWYKSAPLVH